MSPRTFLIPNLVAHCPYQLRINPLCDVVTKKSEQWILKEAKYTPAKRRRFLETKGGVLTAYCYPDADLFHLQVASDYLTWLFCFDDWSDEFDETESCSFTDCIMGCLRDPHGFATNKAAGRLVKDFFRRYLQTSGPRCAKRFIERMDLYLKAVAQQAADRNEGRTPDLESYIALRRDTSAMRTCFSLMEFGAGVDLPDHVVDHPLIRSMEDACNDLVSWSNDIFSYVKEYSIGDTHNIVAVIMEDRKLDLQDAMDFAGELCHKTFERFEADRRALPSWGPKIDRDVNLYVQGLQDWIVGSLYWSFVTKRYFGKEGEAVMKHRTIRLPDRK